MLTRRHPLKRRLQHLRLAFRASPRSKTKFCFVCLHGEEGRGDSASIHSATTFAIPLLLPQWPRTAAARRQDAPTRARLVLPTAVLSSPWYPSRMDPEPYLRAAWRATKRSARFRHAQRAARHPWISSLLVDAAARARCRSCLETCFKLPAAQPLHSQSLSTKKQNPSPLRGGIL